MLTKIKFAPGIDKQDTAVGAEGRWVDSDKIGTDKFLLIKFLKVNSLI